MYAEGKNYEKKLKQRTLEAGGLSPKQYGFTARKSTIDAVSEVITGVRDVCMAVALDVKNSFNWMKMQSDVPKAQRDFNAPKYHYRILQDYLMNRWLEYDTLEGNRKKQVTLGVAQVDHS